MAVLGFRGIPTKLSTYDSTQIKHTIHRDERGKSNIFGSSRRLISTMSSTTCNFDDASLVMDELAMIETTESDSIDIVEDEEIGKIQQTFDSTMCNTPSVLDDVDHPTALPVVAVIETTESASIVAVEDEEEEEEEEKVDLDRFGKLIKDLAHSDNTKVNAALDALLKHNLVKDEERGNTVTAWGGCAALIHLLKAGRTAAMKKSRSVIKSQS